MIWDWSSHQIGSTDWPQAPDPAHGASLVQMLHTVSSLEPAPHDMCSAGAGLACTACSMRIQSQIHGQHGKPDDRAFQAISLPHLHNLVDEHWKSYTNCLALDWLGLNVGKV